MRKLLFILLVISFSSFGQLFDKFEVGIINDADGFTYIRSGQTTDSSIVAKLIDGEFFLFVPTDTSVWYQTNKMWHVSGFVHQSHIKALTTLDRKVQKQLLDSIFDIEAMTYHTQTEGIWNHHEQKFTQVLQLFLHYMKTDYDNAMLEKFIDILQIESGSADEIPPNALGSLYWDYPDQVLLAIEKREDSFLLGQVAFGFTNATYGKSEDFEILVKKIQDVLDLHNE